MRNKILKLIESFFIIIGGLMIVYGTVGAVTVIMVPQGGTGAGVYESGKVLVGNGNNPIATTTYSIPLTDGTNGYVLATDGAGNVTWQAVSGGGGGGSGLWATSTDDLVIYPTTISHVTVLGATATSSSNTILDITGNIFIDGNMDLDVGHTYKINGSNVLNQDVTNGASPTFLTPTISGLVWDGVTFATSSDILNLWNIYESGGNVGIGTATPAYDLDVYGNIRADGDIRTTGTFYGDTWSSITGNSMVVQPTGDTDDFFSFKTPADRPTIKREGGKYIYIESTNIYDAGISIRDGADYSGTFAFEKDTDRMSLSAKNSPLIMKLNSDYDDYLLFQTTSNTPEITVASSSALKINAGGTNALLLNHAGGNVGIGTTSPLSTFSMNSGTNGFRIDSSGIIQQGLWHGTALTDAYVSNTLTVDGYMQDSDINIFAELQSWVSDEVLLKAGTLTDTKYCIYDSASGDIICNSTPTGAGDITDVFNCSTGDCNTMTVGTSEYLTYGTGYIDANRFAGVTTVDATEFGYLNDVTSAIQTQFSGKQGLDDQLTDLADGTLTGNFVNTANPWADNEVADDITASNYVSNTNYYATSTQLFAFCLASTSPEFYSGGTLPAPIQRYAYTVSGINCYVDGGTSVVMTMTDGTNAMDSLTCDADGAQDDGSIANASATANEVMKFSVGTVTGTPDYVCVTIFGNLTK